MFGRASCLVSGKREKDFFEPAAAVAVIPWRTLMVCQHLFHGSLCDDFAFIDDRHMLAQLLRFFEVVCREKNRNALYG